MEKFFDHKKLEREAISVWKNHEVSKFRGDFDRKYIHILPPPNANGRLHLGHASGYTFMDIMARYRKMMGRDVWLIPGKDHAGILTQVVFEKKLEMELGKTRHDLGRTKFYDMCYDFCINSAQRIREQEQSLGVSADFGNEKFTLDPKISKVVKKTFVQMYDDSIIYRGHRMVNWCPRCSTALSDLEVEYKAERGKLWQIKYPLANHPEQYVVVATTRPETMLGDTAVAVHPSDKRYKKLVGEWIALPLTNRGIQIIADKRIDGGFGTGAVKVTPSHDPVDYEIGHDHKLEFISVIDENSRMTKVAGDDFVGLTTIEARTLVLSKLSDLGLLEAEDEFSHNVATCERCGSVIEPLVSLQWFVNVNHPKFSLKQESIKAIEKGQINIYPRKSKTIFISWLKNLHDWCISRQIWWGHQIPVYYCQDCGHEFAAVADHVPACAKCASSNVKQDEDVLDTWFSSGQWTYTTLGWPDNDAFGKLYPTDFMLMGRDIMFFWGIRMLMISLYSTGEVPFRDLYLTGLVLDKQGKKMSKSKGNVIDPVEMIEKYGVDALRFAFVIGAAPGQDFRIYEEKISGYRNFINKIWNASRFVLTTCKQQCVFTNQRPKTKTMYDKWILSELDALITGQHRNYAKYDFNAIGTDLYDFIWSKYCDWYIEISKGENCNDKMLLYVLGEILKLLHPIVPFVTESIWQITDLTSSIALARFPRKHRVSFKEERAYVNKIFDIISRIRALKTQMKIIRGGDVYLNTKLSVNDKIQDDIVRVAGIDNLYLNAGAPADFLKDSTASSEIFFKATPEQIKALNEVRNKEIYQVRRKIETAEKLLNNAGFLKNAKPEVVNATKEGLDTDRLRLQKLIS